jgi:hypothetical protein
VNQSLAWWRDDGKKTRTEGGGGGLRASERDRDGHFSRHSRTETDWREKRLHQRRQIRQTFSREGLFATSHWQPEQAEQAEQLGSCGCGVSLGQSLACRLIRNQAWAQRIRKTNWAISTLKNGLERLTYFAARVLCTWTCGRAIADYDKLGAEVPMQSAGLRPPPS